jgi:hypothetical protein
MLPKNRVIWGAVILLLISTLGCGISNVLVEATPPEASPILYKEDFSNENSGWERSTQGGRKDYYQGTYHINILDPNLFSWSIAQQSMGDVIVSVDMAFTGSAEMAEMGVICRMQNSADFYFFTIRSDGGYAIFKMYQGNEFFLGMDGYQFHPAIKSGIDTNHLEARCVGDQLSLHVNGEHLVSVQDTSYQVGDLGVIVGAFDQPDVNVFFDNFIVSRPNVN